MLAGELVGGYSLSEPQAGSDAAALACDKADDGGYRINGTKAWITHGGRPTSTRCSPAPAPARGISCFLVPGDLPGLSFGTPEEKMGLHAIPTTSAYWDALSLDADRLIGAEGQGLQIAFWRSTRAGWVSPRSPRASRKPPSTPPSPTPTSAPRSAEDHRPPGAGLPARRHGRRRRFRSRHLSRRGAPRDAGRPQRQASVAKLVATDAAMKVTTDAVQVLGGYGYTRDFPVERYMREAKVMQIFEGTNQIQRLVIARGLTAS